MNTLTRRSLIGAGIVGSLLIGVAIGTATSQDDSEADAAAAQAVVDEYEDLEAELRGTYNERLAALEEREETVVQAEAALAAQPEPAPAPEPAPDEVWRPGFYLVPDEMAPGQYRTVNEVTDLCIWNQRKDGDLLGPGSTILTDIGRPIFTVKDVPNSVVEIAGCGDVVRID